MKTIDDVFDPAHNSLNAIRLILASAVIFSHAWLVNGLGLPPMVGGTDPGLIAVAGFFAISGFLVASSRLRVSSLWVYFYKRFLRIYPGFLVALILVACILAPLSTLIDRSSQVEWGSALSYVLSNAGLFVRQTSIDHTLINSPFPFAWNVPLWTLFYEALCYVLIGLLVSCAPRRRVGMCLTILFVIFSVSSLVLRYWIQAPALPILDNFVTLGSFFLAGALLQVYRHRLLSGGTLALVALGLVVALVMLGAFKPLAAMPLAYLVLYLGSRLPFQSIGRRNDISYGLYIYGFPAQQLLMLVLGGAVLPAWLFGIVSIAVTLPLAWLSWLLVEKPALRLASRAPMHRTSAARIVP